MNVVNKGFTGNVSARVTAEETAPAERVNETVAPPLAFNTELASPRPLERTLTDAALSTSAPPETLWANLPSQERTLQAAQVPDAVLAEHARTVAGLDATQAAIYQTALEDSEEQTLGFALQHGMPVDAALLKTYLQSGSEGAGPGSASAPWHRLSVDQLGGSALEANAAMTRNHFHALGKTIPEGMDGPVTEFLTRAALGQVAYESKLTPGPHEAGRARIQAAYESTPVPERHAFLSALVAAKAAGSVEPLRKAGL